MTRFNPRPRSPILRHFATAAALVGWFALTAQFYLTANKVIQDGRDIWWGMVIYFGYFTILTNFLAVLSLTAYATGRKSVFYRLLSKPDVISVIATSIAIVGTIYFLILRHLWSPEGLQWVVDAILHYIMPVAFLIFWWGAVPKGALDWRRLFLWLIYPLGYSLYVMLRGEIIQRYPYPFIDVTTLGYSKVLINIGLISIGFCILSSLLIALNNFYKPHKS